MQARGNEIDKFMGDAIMVVFGAPQHGVDDARRAVTCAVQMQAAMIELNRNHASLGLAPLFMGAGISTGHVMAGLLGLDLSLIGRRADNIYTKVRGTRSDRGCELAALEFTFVNQQGADDIRNFVQLLIRGSPTK